MTKQLNLEFEKAVRTKNQDEIQYGVRKATAIFKYKPENWLDPIFTELKTWQKKYGKSH